MKAKAEQSKTYAESKGEKPFNWFLALKHAQANGLSLEEHLRLSGKSTMWVTCACGNQCAIIPRDSEGHPRDPQLSLLGGRFCMQVEGKDFPSALLTLRKIEKRSKQLIPQILAKKAAASAKRAATLAAKKKKAGRK